MTTRLSGDPAGKGAFGVPSDSMPGETWVVEFVPPALFWCGCPAFTRRQECRHARLVAEAVLVEATSPVTPERRAQAARRLGEIAQEMTR